MNIEINTKGLKIKHSFLILLLIVLITMFFGVVFKILNVNQTFSIFINYVFSFSLSLFVAIKIYEKYAGKYSLDISTKYLRIIPFIIPLPILLQFGLTSHIANLIPMPEFMKQAFYDFGNDSGWATLLTTVILAPILEEIICRGIILKGLLNKYNPNIAIIVSSAIFGIMHLNPWQFIGAFGIGIINGWIFLKTKNIILPIVIHLTNNLFFTIFGVYYGTSYLVEKPIREVFGNSYNQILSISISLILFSYIIYYLNRRFIFKKTKHNKS